MSRQARGPAGRKMVESDSLFAFARPQRPKAEPPRAESQRLEEAEAKDDESSESGEESVRDRRQRFDSDEEEEEKRPEVDPGAGGAGDQERATAENRVRKNRAFLDEIRRAMGDPLPAAEKPAGEVQKPGLSPQLFGGEGDLNFYPDKNFVAESVEPGAQVFEPGFEGRKLFEKPRDEKKQLEDEQEKLLLINGRRVG